MTTTPIRSTQPPLSPPSVERSPEVASVDIAETGWRYETVVLSNGREEEIMVPLTEAEFLHPQEDCHLPTSTFHEMVIHMITELLRRRYAHDPSVGIFGDLIIKWPQEGLTAGLKDHCPDVFVVFGIHDRDRNRSNFTVTEEGVFPRLIFEVVSPDYRKADRVTKVRHYARAGVQEYVILDRRKQRKVVLEEVLGYTLVEGQYEPLLPDEDGRIYLQTIGVSLGLEDGKVVMIDGQTGERLLTPLELEQLLEAERDRAEQAQAQAEQAQAQAEQAQAQAEQERARADRLAELLRAQGLDPDQM